MRERIEIGFEAWARNVVRHRWWVLAGCLLFTLAWATWIPRITFDNSTESFLLKSDPASRLYDEFRERFGQDNQIMIAVSPDDVFDLAFLEGLRRLHHALEDEVPYVEEVTSLLNARSTRGEGDRLIVEDLLEDWPRGSADLARLRERVLSNPVYRNVLISEDATLTTLILKPYTYSARTTQNEALKGFDTLEAEESEPAFLTREESQELVASLQGVVERFDGASFPIFVVGDMVTGETITAAMTRDVRWFMGWSFLVIGALLFLLFRRLSGVLLPFAVVVVGLISTVGIQVAVGIPGSMAMQMIPIFVLTVGVCNSVHVLVLTFQRLNAGAELDDAIAFTFGHSGLAIVMTNITTAAGMSSFITAAITPIIHLGIVASIGIGVVLFYTFGFLPALLAVLPLKRGIRRDASRSPLRQGLLALGDLGTRRPGWVLIGAASLAFLMLLGILQTRFSHKPIDWFPSDDPIRLATERIDTGMRGTNTVEIIIDTGKENGLHDPDTLRRIEAATGYARAVETDDVYVGQAISILDIVKETHQALNENQPSFYAIPEDRRLIAQELLLFENSGSDDLEEITDSQFRLARVTLRVPLLDGALYPGFLSRLEEAFEAILGPERSFIMTGHTPLMSRALAAMVTSLGRSYLFALAVITPLMILLIGRFRIGLLSMVPNLLPVVVVLGVMGLCGVPLDSSNIVIGSVIIGLAVDDTIHFMHRFQREFERSQNVRDAVRQTLSSTGTALLFTSVVLTAGFLVMALFGSMLNTVTFGLVTSLGIATAFISDVLVCPALLALVFQRSDRAAELLRARSNAAIAP